MYVVRFLLASWTPGVWGGPWKHIVTLNIEQATVLETFCDMMAGIGSVMPATGPNIFWFRNRSQAVLEPFLEQHYFSISGNARKNSGNSSARKWVPPSSLKRDQDPRSRQTHHHQPSNINNRWVNLLIRNLTTTWQGWKFVFISYNVVGKGYHFLYIWGRVFEKKHYH